MAEKRNWTEDEDRALRIVFQVVRAPKWSYIARRLQEEFGVKGRNGKQCKERYITFIDPSHPKEEWCQEQEKKMYQLHNELGNKWAVIGCKLGGKSDNSVKNHFYSRLRKSLRKINKVIQDEFRKQYKEIKPNILYRLVQVSEERFKINPAFEKDFLCFSNQLKNTLLDFSYDGEDQDFEDEVLNVDIAKNLIEKMSEFGANYKKKSKKERRGSGYDQDLLTPHRYQPKNKKCLSQNGEESNSFLNSSDMANSEDISDQEMGRANKLKKVRRNSADTSGSAFEAPRVRTRANSNEIIKKEQSSIAQQPPMQDQKEETARNQAHYNEHIQELQVEGILQGLKILEQDQNLPPYPLMMKKQTSKYSRFSQGVVEKEEYHFFQDSQIEMRILPEMELGFRRDSQYQESIFR